MISNGTTDGNPRGYGPLRTQASPIAEGAWHNRSAEEVLAHVGSVASGLSPQAAAQRLAANGPNELEEGKRVSPLQIFLSHGEAGTEVTKQAADMIITDGNFATIVAAVEEGRGVYDNICKTLQYLLAGNTGELLLMTHMQLIRDGRRQS